MDVDRVTDEEIAQALAQDDAAFNEIRLALKDAYTPAGIDHWLHSLNHTLKCTPSSVIVAHKGVGPEVERIINHARYVGGECW